MTPSRATAAHLLAGAAGAAIAIQLRVNAELGMRLDSGFVAVVCSFAGGCLLAVLVACRSPAARRALKALRDAAVPWWTYLAGLGGAACMAAAVTATPRLGVAAVSIALATGQLGGGLAIDRSGLSGARRPITRRRLAAAGLALVAVGVSRPAGNALTPGDAILLVAVLAGGAAIAVQAALNARLRAASSPSAVAAINFGGGLAGLVVVGVVLGLLGALDPRPLPTEPLLYSGGLIGLTIVAAITLATGTLGVLRMALGVLVGQLATGSLLDAALPAGPGLSGSLLLGAALTAAAAVLASRSAVAVGRAGVAR